VIDVTGKFVCGHHQCHGHVGPAPRDPQLRQYALYGVTTTTSMAADPTTSSIQGQAKSWRPASRAHSQPSNIASRRFRQWSTTRRPKRRASNVDEIATHGADFIKVWLDAQGGRIPKLSREFVAAVLDQRASRQAHHGAHRRARGCPHGGRRRRQHAGAQCA